MANDDDFDAGTLLVEVTRLDGIQKKHAGWLMILSAGALALAGLLVNLLLDNNAKADATSMIKVEDRISRAETKQAVNTTAIDTLKDAQKDTRDELRAINAKLDELIKGLIRPRKDK